MLQRLLTAFMIFFISNTILYASQKSKENLTKLYIATFNRAPDSKGLDYWLNISKLNLEGVAQSFFDQPETQNRYPKSVTDEEFINAVYMNLFGRTPDQKGVEYWLNELKNNPYIGRSLFILTVINGAQGKDKDILDNKTVVGLYFVDRDINSIEELYFVDRDINSIEEANEILKGVTSDKTSVDEAISRLSEDSKDIQPEALSYIKNLLISTQNAKESLEDYKVPNRHIYGKEFYVSPDGDDNNRGTLDSPLASLKGAKDAVREYKSIYGLPDGGIVVWFRGGNYSTVDSVIFTEQDSGSKDKPIAYRAYKDENVRIMGGIAIQSEWFRKVSSSDLLWNRLDIDSRDNIFVLNLNDYGISDFGKIDENHYASNAPLELFDDTEPLVIARWPNENETTKIPYYTDDKLVIYGTNLSPDVSGSYTKETNIDSNSDFYTYASYKKDTLVDGKEFYIRHYKAQNDEVRRTWAITDSNYKNASFEHSGTGYNIPRDFTIHSSSASGVPMSVSFDDIQFGFAFMKRGISNSEFEYVGDRPSRWINSGDIWVNGMFYHAWRNGHNLISSIDTSNKIIKMRYDDDLGIKQYETKRAYFVYNLIEELNSPKEYFLDKDSGDLYYYPKKPLSQSNLFVSMNKYFIIKFDGASFVEFHDMALEMSRGDIVQFISGSNNLLNHMKLRLSGRHLAYFKNTTSNSGIEYSILSSSGERAVRLDGGDLNTLEPGNNFIKNSHFIGDNRWNWTSQSAAIGVYGVGNTVEHNDIHGYKYQAIYFNGNNCSISYNNIYDVLKYTEDAGAIYGGRSWHHRGNKINYNFIHDIKDNYSQMVLSGVYFDATLSGEEIIGNIFYNIDGKGILQAGGRDNIIENNLFVHVATPFMGLNSGIKYYSTDPNSSFNMLKRALDYNYKSGVYATQYPKLAEIPDNWDSIIGTHWLLPEGNSFRYNVGEDNLRWILNGKVESGTLDFEVYSHIQMNPLSVNSSDFKPLPYDKIGIQIPK